MTAPPFDWESLFKGLSVEKTTIDELLDDVLLDYELKGKSVRFARNAIDNHLRRYFGGRRTASIRTSDVMRYISYRRSNDQGMRTYRGRRKTSTQVPIRPASNATINRELALLKHAYHMGLKHTPRKVAGVPYIPLLEENNVQKGFGVLRGSAVYCSRTGSARRFTARPCVRVLHRLPPR